MTSKVDCKIVLLGKENGGKSSLVERYLHGRFAEGSTHSTVGAAFGAKTLDVGRSKPVTLGIWDTAGSERYAAMSRIYFRGAQAAVVCYDLTDRESFDRVRYWVADLRSNEEDCAIYLAGTKQDLVDEDPGRRLVPKSMVDDYLQDVGGRGYVTSAKTGLNIENLFRDIATDFSGADQSSSRRRSAGNKERIILDTEERTSKPCACG